jgi:histidinol-phosphate aminotransferase
MNRRVFVQTLGAGAVGMAVAPETAAAQQRRFGATPFSAVRAAIATPIRIGSNENPYGPGPAALAAVGATATGANRYPGPAVQALVDAIAEKHGVPADHVMLSGGSGDILRAIVKATTGPSKGIVAGSPSYESPVRTAQALGAPVKAVPLTNEQRLDLDAMVAESKSAGLFYICNPNNPTATAVPGAAVTSAIDRVIAASPETFVLSDEAYFEYAELPGFETATPLVKKYPQVIIARTFSKIHGMAGMRVGYAIAQPKTIEMLRVHHSASGMSVMSLAAATASLKDTNHLEKQVVLNREVRKMTTDAFKAAGYTVAPSDANFIFVDIRRDARGFQDACRKEGVNVGRSFPPMLNWARISIGTQAEMEMSLPVFMKVLSMPPATTARFDQAVLDALPSELT